MASDIIVDIDSTPERIDMSFSPPPQANLANTNVVRHGGRILTLYEGGLPYEIGRDLASGPVATVLLPRRVPAGLHGSWTPGSASPSIGSQCSVRARLDPALTL